MGELCKFLCLNLLKYNLKEYRKINEKLKELMPFETALKQARQIENLHKIIKNNGGDFNLTQEQIELSKMLV